VGSVSKAARRPSTKDIADTHLPFEEFLVRDLEKFIAELEKTKPKDATIEVEPMEGSNHSPCMSAMQSIVVQSVGPEGAYSMYQYCPVCKTAVRVL
jgi:hypothetical protein